MDEDPKFRKYSARVIRSHCRGRKCCGRTALANRKCLQRFTLSTGMSARSQWWFLLCYLMWSRSLLERTKLTPCLESWRRSRRGLSLTRTRTGQNKTDVGDCKSSLVTETFKQRPILSCDARQAVRNTGPWQAGPKQPHLCPSVEWEE